MIRDRGTIKWTAMMLPEHVTLIREMAEELQRKPRPELDSQKLEEMNELLSEAIAEHHPIVLTYYESGEYRHVVGHIHYFDELNKRLHVIDFFEERLRLSLVDVVDVQFYQQD